MSDTNWWFVDQAAVIAVTGAIALGIISGLDGVARTVIAIPLVLFLPGYALVSALFPDGPNDEYQSFDEEKTGLGNPLLVTGGLEAIERAVLSIVFSAAIVPTITLIASVTPRGVTVEPVVLGLSIFTVALAIVAIVARYRCAPDRRFTPSIPLPFFTRTQPTSFGQPNYRPYNVAIAIGLVLLIASAGFAVANPPQHDGFTEFSVATENVSGETDTMYETTYTAGEPHELETEITNQEHEERTYTSVALLQRVSAEGNESDDVTVQESNELGRQTTTVADGETRSQTLEITPSMQGSGEELRLTLLLYVGDAPSEPTGDDAYREIHLPVEVE
ncbi:DUF1616 domain-containing protein [Natrinema salifodinae]|uniref:Uncharacterized membrane protein n=1 Tax=Natrinema salifodinae TaxID=1202768 RepID=A0A1I0NCD1_9EURY|nr:DUF1616 domain-containing protein [Natrinema salifodinae]SEV99021.1 Uncharacterized membrane protein [Natrinema salifodinae]